MPGISIGDGTNTFFGKDAGKVHGNNGANNLAIGLNAMDDTDAGSTSLSSDENVFIGHNEGGGTWVNNKSRFNTGVGNNSMAAAFNAALSNTALGYNSLNKLTEGASNSPWDLKQVKKSPQVMVIPALELARERQI